MFYARFLKAEQEIQEIWSLFNQKTQLLIRYDTRVYLHDFPLPRENAKDNPISCVFGMNPGSSNYLHPTELGNFAAIKPDPTLSNIRYIYQCACKLQKITIRPSDFVRVMNLSYAATPNANALIALEKKLTVHKLRIECDPVENYPLPDSAWYAWGTKGMHRALSNHRNRLFNLHTPFHAYHAIAGKYVAGLPTNGRAFHPLAFNFIRSMEVGHPLKDSFAASISTHLRVNY